MVLNVETRRLEESLYDPLAEYRATLAAAKAKAEANTMQQPSSLEFNSAMEDDSGYSPVSQPRMKLCRNCGDSVAEMMWLDHHDMLCRNRVIYCPNKRLGCCATVQLSQLHNHLNVQAVDKDRIAASKSIVTDPSDLLQAVATEWEMNWRKDGNDVSVDGSPIALVNEEYGCVVERRKDVLVARSKKRRELVGCIGCGQEVC